MCKKNGTSLFSGASQVFAMAPPGSYAYWVRQATRTLRDSWFGNWQGTDDDGLPNFAKDKFDHAFWEWVSDPKYIRVLQLKAGQQAAPAIDAILAGLNAWRIDCDHTVQIANLYALRMILGPAQFAVRVTPQMRLRDRESTGLTTVAHFGRERPGGDWRVVADFDPGRVKGDPRTDAGRDETLETVGPFVFAPGPPLADTLEQLLERAPAGSRVRWTNLRARLSDPFRHENCVKLARDLYAAGGLDDPVTGNEFTGDRVAIELASITQPRPSRAYIDSFVYIDEIEVFQQM
jgi:hypothetical protein